MPPKAADAETCSR